MTGQEIINQVDILVPNAFNLDTKIQWLNELQREFFELVKVPDSYTSSLTAGATSTTLPQGVLGRNIILVLVGTSEYKPLRYDDSYRPGWNYYTFDDATRTLALTPPAALGGTLLVRYYRTAQRIFTSTTLSQSPDVPQEYHEALVFGLASRVAKAQNDVALGNNYAAEYMTAIQVAQQNFNLNAIVRGNAPQRSGGD